MRGMDGGAHGGVGLLRSRGKFLVSYPQLRLPRSQTWAVFLCFTGAQIYTLSARIKWVCVRVYVYVCVYLCIRICAERTSSVARKHVADHRADADSIIYMCVCVCTKLASDCADNFSIGLKM